MAGNLTAAQGTEILLVTANIGSMFEDPDVLPKIWLEEFYLTVQTYKPQFLALHCQEVGGKDYKDTMCYADVIVKEMLSSEALREYGRTRVYLDEDYKAAEHFTALGSFYFIHNSLRNIQQYDFKSKKFQKVEGREMYTSSLERNTALDKAKFPHSFYPESKFSRKGFIRTRWALGNCAFDLVNVHLYHDASNLDAYERTPSKYATYRKKALEYTVDRLNEDDHDNLPYFMFGDFNFRLDLKQVVGDLAPNTTLQTRYSPTNDVIRLSFLDPEDDEKLVLQLEQKCFHYVNQDIFRENNGAAFLKYDKESSSWRNHMTELEITFPPSYPYIENPSQGKEFIDTRCPAWCDRIFMSHAARDLVLQPESAEKSTVYDTIGSNVCMGDHKPVFLSFRLSAGAGKRNANNECCVMQ